jgi:hypothetical protein
MNSVWFAGLLPLLLAAAPEQAEGSKPADTIAAPSKIRGAEYLRIHADLRVTFRIKAPAGEPPCRPGAHQEIRRGSPAEGSSRRARNPGAGTSELCSPVTADHGSQAQ